MILDLPLRDLAERRVPPVCAKTGATSTTTVRNVLLRPERAGAAWWWFAPLDIAVYRSLLGRRVVVVSLPATAATRLRYDGLRVARIAGFVALPLVVVATGAHSWLSPGGLVSLATIVAWYALHRATRAAWVRPRLRPNAVRVDAHPAFAEAFRNAPVIVAYEPGVVPPASTLPVAGWYPDPGGAQDTERWWDGASWTTTVRASGRVDP